MGGGGERSCSLLVLKTNYVYNFNVFRERKRKPKMRKDIYIYMEWAELAAYSY